MLCTIEHIEEVDSDARDTQTAGHGQPFSGKATWRPRSKGRGLPPSIQTVGTHDSRRESKYHTGFHPRRKSRQPDQEVLAGLARTTLCIATALEGWDLQDEVAKPWTAKKRKGPSLSPRSVQPIHSRSAAEDF